MAIRTAFALFWRFLLWLWSVLIRLYSIVFGTRPQRIVVLRKNDLEHQRSPFLPETTENAVVEDEPFPETYFEQLDDGTESLDRRDWQQRALARGSEHNLMSVSAINASNAYYQEGPGVALVDGPTTPQRLANFFARPFRTNPLKRTKSVSKLDRKRSSNDPDFTSSRPDLQRSQENVCAVGASTAYGVRGAGGGGYAGRFFGQPNEPNTLRSSRSHESLLSYSTTSHMIDLGATEARVHPVHPSVLDVPNCFKVANTYYACRTPVERNRWMENLRRTMNPHRDQMRRTENSLEMWILEAKGVPPKRKYYCEICLDKVLYARTSAKPRADICFWGEHFDFSPIPSIDDVCINLYREADPKKKKDRSTLIGYVQIKIEQLAARHPIERWYTVTASSDNTKLPGLSKDKGEVAAIRMKARYQSVEILPMHMYEELIRFVRMRYLSLSLALEPILGVKAKEDFATALVRIMHKQRIAKDFLCDLIMSEVEGLDNEHLMFRGNSLATKAMEAYMKLVADEYLQETLGEFVKTLMESDENCEVDPLKMTNVNPMILEKNRHHLTFNVEAAWGKIVNSTGTFPVELREIFDNLRRRLDLVNRRDLADTLISSSIFLRFLCPAILSPSLFNLVSEYPSGRVARNLTLIAKTLQTLANFTKFGGKEHYMEFMNEFVSREWDNMHQYLVRISSASPRVDKNATAGDWDAAVDLGRELSLLHSYLDEVWTPQVHEQAVKNDQQLEDLSKILGKLSVRRHGDSISDLRDHSSHTTQTPTSDYDNSAVLRSRNHNPLDYAHVHSHVMTRSTPASHLNTSDDYVRDDALKDSIAVRQAGLIVQQHRHGQHKNNRLVVDGASRDLLSQRSLPLQNGSPSQYNGDDDSRNRGLAVNGGSGYNTMENGSAATTSSSVSRTSTKSYSTSASERHHDDETDSDDAVGPQARHARPPRKGKRRVNGAGASVRNETPTRPNPIAPPPPSSGYQSQNHSSSSSNSSSPVERSSISVGEALGPRPALAIPNKNFATHTNLPSTSSPSFEKLWKDDPRGAIEGASPSKGNAENLTYYRPSALANGAEGVVLHEGGKFSLPRTNPRYTGRISCGGSSMVGVVKPTLIDIGNDPEGGMVTATPVRSGTVTENNNDLKGYNAVWATAEQRPAIPDRWSSIPTREATLQQNPQDIIEQQKREIKRLMRENEELKKHVAAQHAVAPMRPPIAARTADPQPFADSGASEDSYDSLSSLNEVPEALPTATHC